MDRLTFIVEIVKALAWPVSALLIALLFRKQLVALLKTIKKGKLGPAEFEFERGIQAIEASAVDLPSAPTSTKTIKDAASNPRGAVLESWLTLEEQAINLAIKRGLTNATARRYALGAIQSIKRSGLLKPDHMQILDELQGLRNRAAHDPDFSPDPSAVVAYVRLAGDLGLEMESLTP